MLQFLHLDPCPIHNPSTPLLVPYIIILRLRNPPLLFWYLPICPLTLPYMRQRLTPLACAWCICPSLQCGHFLAFTAPEESFTDLHTSCRGYMSHLGITARATCETTPEVHPYSCLTSNSMFTKLPCRENIDYPGSISSSLFLVLFLPL